MALETGASRFTLVGRAAMAPAQCAVTGQIEGLVDLGRTIPMYGRLYLSVDAIRELAEVAGITERTDATLQQHEWYEQGYQAAVEKDFNGTLAGLIAELGAIAARAGSTDVVPAPVDDGSEQVAHEEPRDGDDDLRGADEGAAAVERETGAAGGKQRRGRVQRTSLDDAFQL